MKPESYIIKLLFAYFFCYMLFQIYHFGRAEIYRFSWVDIYLFLPLIYAAIALSLKQITKRNNNTNE